ncbi:MAG: PH domain-containing protein [Candidatus Woesearchaeota archaeon]
MEKVLMVLRKSRKSFILEYFSAILLLSLLAIVYLKGITIARWANYLIFGLVFVSLSSAELSRIMHRYVVTESKITVIDGLIQQRKQNIYFFSLRFVPRINVKQGRIQRLLNYGTIYVEEGDSNKFELKDVDDPHNIMSKIEVWTGMNQKKE